MFTYADPRACPSCRTRLSEQSSRCTTCDVPLGHPLATQVFESLQRTDVLVAELRAVETAAPAAVTVAVPAAVPAPTPAFVPSFAAPHATTGVRASSVPAILLSLGALCLLVAAVAFLAVAWSWLGIGGRTAVLVGLTGATAAGGLVLRRRDLRLAAESLLTVSLGLLVLDVLGADDAGWFGDLSGAGVTLVVGVALAAGGAALVAADRRLVVPQVALVAGLFVAQAVAPTVVGHPLLLAALAVVGFVALARLARAVDLAVVAVTAGVAAAYAWLDLAGSALLGLAGLDALTTAELWTSGSGPALAAAALLVLAPVALTRDHHVVQVCLAASASLMTGVLALPVLDDGATRIALASLVFGLAWTVAAHVVPRRVLAVPSVPAALSLLPAAAISLSLGAQALDAVLTLSGEPLRLQPDRLVASPWVLVPSVLAVIALALALVPPARRASCLRVAVALVALAAVTTLSLHEVPLWTVVGSLSLVAVVAATDGVRRPGAAALLQMVAVAGLLLGTALVALPSSPLLLVPVTIATAAAAAAMLVGRFDAAAEAGGLALAPSVTALVWTVADVVGLDAASTAVPVLLVLGGLVLARPRLELEVPAAVAALVSAAVAVPLADDAAVSLALHLTLAGALVTLQSLVHPSHRRLAWVGGALLVLATWVRLVDLGVEAPEPYTLPAATALVVVGLLRLHRDRGSSTRTTLLPGLGLATVPSLLQVLQTDPVSLRALLLGTACLVLVLAGARLRWSAPLLVGAVVGALLTLVELSPYAAETPQWVVIGFAGTVLTVVGVTWERRVLDVQRAASYVGRLR